MSSQGQGEVAGNFLDGFEADNFTIPEGKTLQIEGTINNYDTIFNNGTITNNGSFFVYKDSGGSLIPGDTATYNGNVPTEFNKIKS